MTILEIVSIIAIISGPVIAVLITLLYQSRKEKRDAKLTLFLTLMAHRKSSPPTKAWVDSLNLIDIVFAKQTNIVTLWHEYYSLLHRKPLDESSDHKYLDLLLAMSKHLGYKNIQQTDIDKFYTPVAHGDQAILETKLQLELLRVLENTHAILALKTQDIQTDKTQELR